ncbi:MAG: sulfurtransferase [Bacterioplanes sp.]|nr:sulfurtransferase [Bacterioplanes sp.]
MPNTASAPELGLLIEPETLAAHLTSSNLLIIDQSSQDTYRQHHVPGAVHVDFKRLQLGVAPTPGALPSLDALSTLFSEIGLTPDTHVIAYDDEGGGWAGRLIWILDCIGHTRYSYLNGGIHAWLQAGLATEQEEHVAASSHYEVTELHDGFSLTKEDILQRLGRPDFAIWDARSAAEYSGEKVISARGGHIPGAIHFEWTAGMDKERGLRVLDLEVFRTQLQQLGLNQEQEIVTHCQTHHRSGFTYLVGKLLGFNIKAYAGSWSEWGNDPNTPIHTGKQP